MSFSFFAQVLVWAVYWGCAEAIFGENIGRNKAQFAFLFASPLIIHWVLMAVQNL